jgi:hypothetical protein
MKCKKPKELKKAKNLGKTRTLKDWSNTRM